MRCRSAGRELFVSTAGQSPGQAQKGADLQAELFVGALLSDQDSTVQSADLHAGNTVVGSVVRVRATGTSDLRSMLMSLGCHCAIEDVRSRWLKVIRRSLQTIISPRSQRTL